MTLRLFESPQDAAEDAAQARHEAASARARFQARCGSCGCFQRAGTLRYGLICVVCFHDKRPGIRRKVEQARIWWEARRERFVQSGIDAAREGRIA